MENSDIPDISNIPLQPCDLNFHINNIPVLWDLYGLSAKRQRFAVVVRHFSENRTGDWKKEWDYIGGIDGSDLEYCVCSQHITNSHVIKNTINGISLEIGSECIKKMMPERAAEVHKEDLALKYKGDKRPCQHCGKHRLSDYSEKYGDVSYRTICKACWTEGIRPKEEVSDEITGDEMITFGKYKGHKFKVIDDKKYIKWVLTLKDTKGCMQQLQKYLKSIEETE